MPEGLELGTLADAGSVFVRDTTPEQRLLKDIRIDATNKESKKLQEGHPARKEMVFSVSSSEAYWFLRFGSRPGVQTPESDNEEYDDENPDMEDMVTPGLPSTPYPPQYRTQDVDVHISTHRLQLKAFHPSHRNVILEFSDANGKELWLQVQTLTHTTMTIYNRQRWEASVGKVPKSVRGHKVVLALVFKDHVVAFTTLDMITKIFWASMRKELPDQLPVLHLTTGLREWMEELVWWMRFRHAQETHKVTVSKIKDGKFPWIKPADVPAWIAIGEKIAKSGLPTHRRALGVWVVRRSGMFPGIGVYSAPEVFHGGGLLVDVREADIFDSASRTGRLCAAVYSFLIGNKPQVFQMVQARTKDFTLAVSTKHRKEFGKKFLRVWAQERTHMSQRQKKLIQTREARALLTDGEVKRLQDVCRLLKRDFVLEEQVPDPFEPDCVRFALEQEGTNFGSLIFGEEHWDDLSKAAGLPDGCRVSDNPLAQYFKEFTDEWPTEKDGLLRYCFKKPGNYIRPPFEASKRYLDLPSYYDNPLFSPQGTSKNAWVETQAYRENWLPKTRRNPGSDIWTAFPLHEPPRMEPIRLRLHDELTRSKRLSLYIIMCTNGWTVGAFDFCGVPREISTAAEKRMIAYCWEDPTLTLFYRTRLHYERVTRLLDEKQHKLGLDKVAKGLIEKKKAAELEERREEAKAKKLGLEYKKPPKDKNSNDHSIIEGYKAFLDLQDRLQKEERKRKRMEEKQKRMEEKQKRMEAAQHPLETSPAQSSRAPATSDAPPPKKRRIRGDKATLEDGERLLAKLAVAVPADGERRQTRLRQSVSEVESSV